MSTARTLILINGLPAPHNRNELIFSELFAAFSPLSTLQLEALQKDIHMMRFFVDG